LLQRLRAEIGLQRTNILQHCSKHLELANAQQTVAVLIGQLDQGRALVWAQAHAGLGCALCQLGCCHHAIAVAVQPAAEADRVRENHQGPPQRSHRQLRWLQHVLALAPDLFPTGQLEAHASALPRDNSTGGRCTILLTVEEHRRRGVPWSGHCWGQGSAVPRGPSIRGSNPPIQPPRAARDRAERAYSTI
jgi:hypothetical protein